jgi:hypothetical protein
LERVLSIEDGSGPHIGLAVDWEPSAKGTMPYPELRRFVELFNERMRPRYADRYPILYGGFPLRETRGILAGDPLLAKCPLWYARYTKNHPLEIPSNTWPTYTLWQFVDEHAAHVQGHPDAYCLASGAACSSVRGAGIECDKQRRQGCAMTKAKHHVLCATRREPIDSAARGTHRG